MRWKNEQHLPITDEKRNIVFGLYMVYNVYAGTAIQQQNVLYLLQHKMVKI